MLWERRLVTAWLLVLGLLAAALYWRAQGGLAQETARTEPVGVDGGGRQPPPRAVPDEAPAGARYVIVGGGPSPDANELSIEEDVLLAREVLGPRGVVLFAGGGGSESVHTLDASPRGDPVIRALAALFGPRGSHHGSFRRTRISGAGAATRRAVESAVSAALQRGTSAVNLVLHGHGDRGEPTALGSFAVWGRDVWTVRDLDAVLGAARLEVPVRIISSACFSGAFAEILFKDADAGAGPADGVRCGLFAAPADLESTGCDPDPAATLSDGFGVHFWNALRRRDVRGGPLAAALVDFDGDGTVSFLEAHARVRIASGSADVPTVTHERWLEVHADVLDAGETAELALPETDAVIAALSARLDASGLSVGQAVATQSGGLERVAEALARAEAIIDEQVLDLEDAQAVTDGAWSELAGLVLAAWPALDDPWHPDFARDLSAARPTVLALLTESPEARAWNAAREAEHQLDAFIHSSRVTAAPLERLNRALLSRRRAGRLAARGGPDWEVFQQILACERGRL